MNQEDTKPEDSDQAVNEEELTAGQTQPTPPDPPGGSAEQPGIDVPLSQLLPALLATCIFGGGLRNLDGTLLTSEQLGMAFVQQSSLILRTIHFDEAVEEIIPGAGTDVNPMYIVGGGIAASVGLAFLMRPPKTKGAPIPGKTEDTANDTTQT